MNVKPHVVRKYHAFDIEYLLSQLSPELRKVAVLRFFEDQSYEGVASGLGCPIWKAKKLISKLLRTLREVCGIQVFQIAPGHDVRYFPDFLPKPDADLWLTRLSAEVPYRSETISMCGKQFVLKRQTAQYDKNYRYNPTAQNARDWSPLLTDLRALVEQAIGVRFHSAFCNLYPDGEAYIGPYHDGDHSKVIAFLSFGAVREIRFTNKSSIHPGFSMELAHGSLLLIPESVNEGFKHMVPKSKQVTRPRINVTFRSLRAA